MASQANPFEEGVMEIIFHVSRLVDISHILRLFQEFVITYLFQWIIESTTSEFPGWAIVVFRFDNHTLLTQELRPFTYDSLLNTRRQYLSLVKIDYLKIMLKIKV